MAKYNCTRLTSSGQIVTGGGHSVVMVHIGGGTSAAVKFYDNTSAVGTEKFGTGSSCDLYNVGGVYFPSVGIYAEVSGSLPIIYVFWK